MAKSKKISLKLETKLEKRIIELIHEYDGKVSLVAVIGILDTVKDRIKEDCE